MAIVRYRSQVVKNIVVGEPKRPRQERPCPVVLAVFFGHIRGRVLEQVLRPMKIANTRSNVCRYDWMRTRPHDAQLARVVDRPPRVRIILVNSRHLPAAPDSPRALKIMRCVGHGVYSATTLCTSGQNLTYNRSITRPFCDPQCMQAVKCHQFISREKKTQESQTPSYRARPSALD